ncbi:hypothetical protein [Kordia jejudonensis]|uniref:hypothetical protein n=1 Tax=Kordia jejudonensis TaxID=1348245 RepID=UPI0012E00AE3|nr:hypothetical protein [Kordia jejudonensis]
MKKLWLLFILVFAFGCDDGDLALEEIDFTSDAAVSACDLEAGVTLLFKIDDTEALILEIPSTLIVNTITEDEEPREGNLTNTSVNAYYRGFNTTVTSSYFCDQLPPVDVEVNLEYTANNGIVKVVTTAAAFDAVDPTIVTDYRHEITFENIVFSNDAGESITYEGIFDYGFIVTPAE